MIQKIADNSQVRAWSRFCTIDGHQLKADCLISFDRMLNTVTDRNEPGEQKHFEQGTRIRTFPASIEFSHQEKNHKLVFHRGDTSSTQETRDASLQIPGTIMDCFWMRDSSLILGLLKNSALDVEVSVELKQVLQDCLIQLGRVFESAGSAIELEQCSDSKSSGILKFKSTEVRVNLEAFHSLLVRNFISELGPSIQQFSYCLGRHRSSLNRLWIDALALATPPVISSTDLSTKKWSRRFASVQKAGLIDKSGLVNWWKIDTISQGGRRLQKFIEGCLGSRRVGLERLIEDYQFLTPESTVEDWKVSSMARLLYYYLATVRRKEDKQGPSYSVASHELAESPAPMTTR